jgi:UDP-N-acetylglucosamine diphosphorylase / glucose-1-phosphate thymidylyltransferase / UDP-N-acetylgalactosamine diphosphorylase / glucosamine-1-phosphate N-acetyltransferase / galactosamine-1-phosphate N-acetyltransferase
VSSLPDLFANLPDAFGPLYDPDAPWTLLDDALTKVLGDDIVIHETARVHPSAVIEGPVFIGRDAMIRPGANVRGGSWIGERAVVGTNTEVKRGIFLPGAMALHLNYVGDSILGANAKLAAGTILSNFRHDGASISIRGTDTGRRKLGAILGDGVLTGCNSVLHPGCVVGRETQIYPGVQLRPGVYPAASIIKLKQEIEVVAQRR